MRLDLSVADTLILIGMPDDIGAHRWWRPQKNEVQHLQVHDAF